MNQFTPFSEAFIKELESKFSFSTNDIRSVLDHYLPNAKMFHMKLIALLNHALRFGGMNHLFCKIKWKKCAWDEDYAHVILCEDNRFGSYDYDGFFRLMVAAHDECIRFYLLPHKKGWFKICFHQRQRTGETSDKRHPTMEDHIKSYRNEQFPVKFSIGSWVRVSTEVFSSAAGKIGKVVDFDRDDGVVVYKIKMGCNIHIFNEIFLASVSPKFSIGDEVKVCTRLGTYRVVNVVTTDVFSRPYMYFVYDDGYEIMTSEESLIGKDDPRFVHCN